ncbi:MAG TPA: nickel pincer cofactor biosynthesis protein LarC [Herpetosiphonaceae bacterium]
MRVAYFDCFSGISGDMTLGALIDAGLDADALRAELALLDLPGWELRAERVVRYHMAATHVRVVTEEQHAHRHLSDIAAILGRSKLPDGDKRRALAIFTRLAEAEAAVHGTTRDEVHFHEVGALDAIVDIVGAVIGLRLMGIERVFASALPPGGGWINAAHGRIPIPGPAVLQLLGAVKAPMSDDTTPFELVTPTGAALLAELAEFARPPLAIEATGYGAGTRDIGRLNALRLLIGELADRQAPADSLEQVVLLETNIDDLPGEQLAYAAERLLAAGALDAWWAPIGMKKGRPAAQLAALVRPADEEAAVETIFRETGSLGVRRQPLERWVCGRSVAEAATPWGAVRVKRQLWRGRQLGASPEYEDCARLAREHGVPLRDVYAAARRALAPEPAP